MKKRIFAVISAAVLALSCFTAVSAETLSPAAPKSAAGVKAQKWIESGAASSLDAGVITKDSDAEVFAFGSNKASMFEMLSHLAAQYPKDKLIGGFNVDLGVEDSADIAVTDDKIAADKKYALRHFNEKTGEWDSSSASLISLKAGIVKFTVTKNGAYALVESKSGSSAVVVSNEKKTVAPKTGEV